jgi:hypothetical protein
VPDFGLAADGGMTLDYGRRRFVVGFDEQLKPQVFDDAGNLRKVLPKPGAKDDPDLAPAAYRAFTGLKKDVRTVAADQIWRLERAMCAQRRWTVADFRALLVGHPLLWHLVRRLVWLHDEDGGDGGDGGGKVTAFRVAEDRTFADSADEVLTLPETGNVRIAHPVRLGNAVAAWSEVFADYEILQPFPQLGRPVETFTEEEAGSDRLDRVAGVTVSTGLALGLERVGWERGRPEDAGVQNEMVWYLSAGWMIVLETDPGFPVMSPGEWAEQKLGAVRIRATEGYKQYDITSTDWRRKISTGWRRKTSTTSPRFGDLDDLTTAELLFILARLRGSAA